MRSSNHAVGLVRQESALGRLSVGTRAQVELMMQFWDDLGPTCDLDEIVERMAVSDGGKAFQRFVRGAWLDGEDAEMDRDLDRLADALADLVAASLEGM